MANLSSGVAFAEREYEDALPVRDLARVRILHRWLGGRGRASLKPRRVIDTPMLAVHRLILAALCGFAALLIPNLAQADGPRGDLDGDGIRDRIEFGRGARELAIRFSRTHHWQRLPVRDLIVKFVVTDVDHDGNLDLVANTRQSGLHVWINQGRGLFGARSHYQGARYTRCALHHAKPAVHGVRTVRFDDSTLNDSSRLLGVKSPHSIAQLVVVGDTSILAHTRLTESTSRRRAPRGPPPLLVS